MHHVEKSWGSEIWICNSKKYCGKKLFVQKGKWCSLHFHKLKDEVLFFETNGIRFAYGSLEKPKVIEMQQGDAFHVEPGLPHQFYALEDAVIFEFSTQHFDEDSFRITTELIAG